MPVQWHMVSILHDPILGREQIEHYLTQGYEPFAVIQVTGNFYPTVYLRKCQTHPNRRIWDIKIWPRTVI